MHKTLRKGSSGSEVTRLQMMLNRVVKPKPPLALDGDFGPVTESAVQSYQRTHQLVPDGIVGPQTWAKLDGHARAPQRGEVPGVPPLRGNGSHPASSDLAEQAVTIAMTQNGVREEPLGSNRGAKVDEYNRTAGTSLGSFWCMSFVYWCYNRAATHAVQANPMPKTAYCPYLYSWAKREGKLTATPQRGDVFLVKGGSEGHFHTGIVISGSGGQFQTVEGNTNNDGSSNGIGVFLRHRAMGTCDFVRLVSGSVMKGEHPSNSQIAWGQKVSSEFKKKVIAISRDLSIDPNHLMACMAFETGETFSPSIKNGAGSGATGLIQFMPDTAKGLGTSTGALAGMTAVQQLDYVKKYFQQYTRSLKTLEDVYLAIFYPAAIGKNPQSALPNSIYAQNSGLDANKDGKITPAEISSRIRDKYSKGLQKGYLG